MIDVTVNGCELRFADAYDLVVFVKAWSAIKGKRKGRKTYVMSQVHKDAISRGRKKKFAAIRKNGEVKA